jgi:hypothetical protein
MTKPTEYDALCRSGAERERLAKQVEEVAARHGATVRRASLEIPRNITLYVVFGPYRCMISFAAGTKGRAFLGHWFITEDIKAHYPVNFGADINGSINVIGYRKATTCTRALCTFLHSIDRGLRSLAIEHPEHKAAPAN